ncbi:peritrophin-48 [Drosophila rhopaloa]|uniref:Chitin-binding type-2 domain-containing protein n=1 Tax=Drosophila rhopaloa TaxID=1041015 RepID=A0ABM5I6Z5_DRORH|nr:peritrophin-48 [Drosophila rhopaloa]
MGGQKGSIIAALALLVACAAPATADLNVTALCLLVRSGSYVASQTECSTYYQCQGSQVTTLTCPTGYYFDKNAQQCTGTVPSTCIDSNNPCQGKAVGSFAGTTTSCGGYYYCGSSGAVRGNCPAGENFNPTTMACVYANNYPCRTSSDSDTAASVLTLNLCNLIKNGVYFGSPSNCSGWNFCQDNVLRSGSCAKGFVYNVAASNCGYQTISSCSQVTNDPSLTGAAVPTICSKAGSMIKATACNQYYMCSASGSYQLMTCPSGYYYDTISEACVTRMLARNDCDRCVGTTASFVNAYSASNCSDYLYCVNGVQKDVETCPTGYYFNENSGACVNGEEPQFRCCNPLGNTGIATTAAPSTSTNGTSSGSSSTGTSSGSSSTGTSSGSSSTGTSSGSSSTGTSSGSSSTGTSSGSSSTDTSSGSSSTGTSSGSSSTGTSSGSSSTGSSTDTSSGKTDGTSTDTSSAKTDGTSTDTSSAKSDGTSTGTSSGTSTSTK